jgi:ubiquinone/menaquinone biosynthesis C-methylase UbiE
MTKRHYTDYDQVGAPEAFDAGHFGGPVGQFFQKSQEELVCKLIAPGEATILDVGTGTGRLAIPLALRGAEVIGVDASREMLRRAKEKAGALSNISFQLADARRLPFSSEAFDYVISFRTLMHFEDWAQVISEMCRVSKRFVIFDAPPTAGVALLERLFNKIRKTLGSNVSPYRTFLQTDLERELTRNDFEVVIVEKQFVLPLKVHRTLGSLRFTKASEGFLGFIGMTKLLGAPILIKAARKG